MLVPILSLVLALTQIANGLQCRVCTNCEMDHVVRYSICGSTQSCYVLNRVHPKMTEMGCGTSCSLVERSRRPEDQCYLCHYDYCNSGQKVVVRGQRPFMLDDKAPFHTEDELPPFPVEDSSSFEQPVRIADLKMLNGTRIRFEGILPIPVDELAPSRKEMREDSTDLLNDDDFDALIEEELGIDMEDLDAMVDNQRAARVREEEEEETIIRKDEATSKAEQHQQDKVDGLHLRSNEEEQAADANRNKEERKQAVSFSSPCQTLLLPLAVLVFARM